MLDCIVLGAGLAGLTAAARLARAGQRVLVLEKHLLPGGCATHFSRRGITFEIGLHELNGLDENDPKMELWQELNLHNLLESIPLPEVYTVICKSLKLSLPVGRDAAFQTLVTSFPAESKAIASIFQLLEECHALHQKIPDLKWMEWLTKTSLTDYLDSLGVSPELRMLLLANVGYYHHNPDELSLFWWGVGQASYILGGTHYLKGGSQALSNVLASIIETHGGQILYRQEITRIKTAGNQILAVITHKGTEYSAPLFLSGLPLPRLAALCQNETWQKKMGQLRLSPSLTSLYLAPQKPLASPHWCTIYLEEETLRKHQQSALPLEEFHTLGLTLVNYGLNSPDKPTAVISALDSQKGWPKRQNPAYRKLKEQRSREWLTRLGLGETPLAHAEMATPHTIERYTGNPEGVIYGFAQSPEQSGMFRPGHRTPYRNLLAASAWIRPGGGFSGAMLSGWQTAGKILAR